MWRWLIVIWAVFGKCKGKYEEAIAAYQRAIKLKSDFALAHRNLEGLLASRGIGLCG